MAKRNSKKDHSLTKIIGKRLRIERKRINKNQEEFAAIGGVSRTTQYLYESGMRSPSLQYLFRAVAVGVDFNYLAYGKRGDDSSGRLILSRDQLFEAYIQTDYQMRDRHGRLFDIETRAKEFLSKCKSFAHGKSCEFRE